MERGESRVEVTEVEGDVKLWTGLDEATSKPEICGKGKKKIPDVREESNQVNEVTETGAQQGDAARRPER